MLRNQKQTRRKFCPHLPLLEYLTCLTFIKNERKLCQTWNKLIYLFIVYCLLPQYLTNPQVEAILGLRHTRIDKQIRRVKRDQKIQKWTRTYM